MHGSLDISDRNATEYAECGRLARASRSDIIGCAMSSVPDALRKHLDSPQPDWAGVLSGILQLFNCQTGTIHVLDRDKGFLFLKTQTGIPEALLPKVAAIPVGKGMAGIAAERREPVQVCNLQTDKSGVVRPAAKDTKMEGSIAVPLLLDGEVVGTLGIAKPVAYEFSKEEIATIEEIADAISRKITD
jgi:L-methionine (R)-S-oxide reductase